jgi:hypothetical protein
MIVSELNTCVREAGVTEELAKALLAESQRSEAANQKK